MVTRRYFDNKGIKITIIDAAIRHIQNDKITIFITQSKSKAVFQVTHRLCRVIRLKICCRNGKLSCSIRSIRHCIQQIKIQQRNGFFCIRILHGKTAAGRYNGIDITITGQIVRQSNCLAIGKNAQYNRFFLLAVIFCFLFKTHCHIIISKITGLGKTIAIIIGSQYVKLDFRNFAKTGHIPFGPFCYNIFRSVSQIYFRLSRCTICMISCRNHLYIIRFGQWCSKFISNQKTI